MTWRFTLLIFSLVAFPLATASSCDSFLDPKGRSVVDFSPPPGFIEVCSRQSLYCEVLMMTAPPAMKIIAFFVLTDEWQRFLEGEAMGFTRDLTVEQPRMLTSEKFAEVKRQIRKTEGEIWEDSSRPSPEDTRVLHPMVVLDETTDLISFMVGGRFIVPSEEGVQKEMTAVTVKTVLQLKGETLWLHTHEQRDHPFDRESIRTLAKRWIECIKTKNGR